MDVLQASLVPASVEYHFSLPTPMVIQQEVKTPLDPDFSGEILCLIFLVQVGFITNSPLPRTPRTVSTQVGG